MMIIWLKRILLAIFFLVVVAVAVFYYQSWNKIKSVEKTVIKYNEILPEVYKTFKSGLLSDYASEREVGKVEMYLALLKFKEGKWLKTELKKLDFNNIKVDRDKGIVETYEEWIYQYFDMDTGNAVGSIEYIKYNGEYRLIWENKKWKINSFVVEEIDTKEEKKQNES